MVSEERDIVLASASPRRRALLEAACFKVAVRATGADETWPGGREEDAVITIARRKLRCAGPCEHLTLAADTAVMIDGLPLGKPEDEDGARGMIRALSGRRHHVLTGFCLSRGGTCVERAVRTAVWFRVLTDVEIEAYVASGEPFDKAGAYAIQGRGGSLVERIEGSYTNVVGLPLEAVLAAMESIR